MTWHSFRKNQQIFCNLSLSQAMALRDTMLRCARAGDQISVITSSNSLPAPQTGIRSLVITEHSAPSDPCVPSS